MFVVMDRINKRGYGIPIVCLEYSAVIGALRIGCFRC
jgi:hypothetical protein